MAGTKQRDRFETMVQAHLSDKLDAARRLQELAERLQLSELQKIEVAEILAILTRTVKEIW